jgi:hypothetical protein
VTELEENLFYEFWNKLNGATDKGFGEIAPVDYDADFIEALRHNNGVFSAFKVHRMQNDMAAGLLDENGELKSFEQWLNDVLPIADHQNRVWFQTEYDTAVKRAHQAAEWRQFENEADDAPPNLEWIQTTSVHPAEEHAAFWSIPVILPMDDPFWDRHRPCDRWGCKCQLRATDKPATPANRIPDGGNRDKPSPGLDVNPAKGGQIFSDSHPYNPPSCAACTLPGKKVLLNRPTGRLASFFNAGAKGKKDCYNCSRPVQLMNEARKKTEGAKATRQWAKENIQGTTVKHFIFEKEIQISGGGIREFTNQPHKHFFEKNDLLKDLQGLFNSKTTIYRGITAWKGRKSHIFEITLMGEKSYIIANEIKGQGVLLYGITESDKVLDEIIKP